MFIVRNSSYKRSTSKKTCYNYKLLTTYPGNILCFDDNCMSSFVWYCAYVAINIYHWCESMYTNSKHTGYDYQQCLTSLYCEKNLCPSVQIVACCPDSTRPLLVTMLAHSSWCVHQTWLCLIQCNWLGLILWLKLCFSQHREDYINYKYFLSFWLSIAHP